MHVLNSVDSIARQVSAEKIGRHLRGSARSIDVAEAPQPEIASTHGVTACLPDGCKGVLPPA